MSGVSSNYNLSLDVGKEKSILWLGTFYFDNIPYGIQNMNENAIWGSPELNFMYVDFLLKFQLAQISDLEFRLTCFQNKAAPQGYTLRFHFFMNIFHDGPKVFQMQSNEVMIFERFWLDASYREHFSPEELNKRFYLKIKIEMIEYDCSSSRMHMRQENEFRLMKKRFFKDDAVLNDLCYILNVPRLKDIFTGRQNSQFFRKKCTFIKRTATFSKEIADYIEAKEACISVPQTNLSIILNFIMKGERSSINNADLFEMHFQAHHLGLNDLAILSRDLILTKIECNSTFLTDALVIADRVNDDILFDKVAEKFHYFEQKENSEGWLERFKSNNIMIRFTAHSLKRRMKKRESAGHEEIAKTSA